MNNLNTVSNQSKITVIPNNTNTLPRVSAERYAIVFRSLNEIEKSKYSLFHEVEFLNLPTYQDQLNYLKQCCQKFITYNEAAYSGVMTTVQYGIALLEKQDDNKFKDNYIQMIELAKNNLRH